MEIAKKNATSSLALSGREKKINSKYLQPKADSFADFLLKFTLPVLSYKLQAGNFL